MPGAAVTFLVPVLVATLPQQATTRGRRLLSNAQGEGRVGNGEGKRRAMNPPLALPALTQCAYATA